MMSEPLWRDGPWELLQDLRRLVADRAPLETEIFAAYESRNRANEKGFQAARKAAEDQFQRETAQIAAESEAQRQRLQAQIEGELTAARRDYESLQREIRSRSQMEEATAREALQEAEWHAGTKYDGAKNALSTRLAEVSSQLHTQWQEFEGLQKEAERILRRRWQWRRYAVPETPTRRTFEDPVRAFAEALGPARHQLQLLQQQSTPAMFEGIWPPAILLILWVLAAMALVPWGMSLEWRPVVWAAISGGTAAGLWLMLGLFAYPIARRQSTQAYLAFRQVLCDAAHAQKCGLEAVKASFDKKLATLQDQRHADQQKAQDAFHAAVAVIQERAENATREADARQLAAVHAAQQRGQQLLEESAAVARNRQAELTERHQGEMERLQRKFDRKMSETEVRFRQQWDAMAQRWLSGMQRFTEGVQQLEANCRQAFPDWNTAEWSTWAPATRIPSAIAVARADVRLEWIDGGVPHDPRLAPPASEFTLPVTFPSRDLSTLLFTAQGEGLSQAVAHIQSVMLRMLTSLPPGKVRFMILDPVGLGENFSAFMHLADYNDQLVSNRIWTDTAHIEQHLAELTGHMENVIQVYLRNEFQSIDQYNQFAGDLAEPYRVLVVANFPAGFSEPAAARLASIVASGARCGVYTVMSVDTRLRMPRDFHLADVQRHALELAWKESRFDWKTPETGQYPVAFLPPPAADRFTEIVRTVGHAAKDADRVQVPFDCVVPPETQWWTGDAAEGIDVPLGRAGAMKLQSLRLGRGTSQHVLIAGKTGSGKSTLLHALVTNAALRYSPDEVEFYLVDFKKGVEFKSYANLELPHARVIAIESEREFGVSVLERLDQELKVRGELYRAAGVQDLAGFRAARPDLKLPRILLIVDEFQELFVEDDRVSQSASLLMDRLVRQGRAFGIHVLLGSQTLAGSYSLPRSTIGQMAVRIALQCSEADAHLILSEDNTAARLLGRPGEAIYNDANGLYEGNHPFQVVWLADEQRELYLQRVQQFARSRQVATRPAIVFEGNRAADPVKNPLLHDLLSAPAWPAPAPVARGWLGEAVAIKDPTAVAFARQSGNNLLLIGHQEEEALGTLAACLVSLAAQHAPGGPGDPPGAKFYILDGARAESPGAGFWGRITCALPHGVKLAPVRGAAGLIGEISEELARREQSPDESAAPIYLFVYDLARFRDLRRAEDDYSFSRSDEDKPPSAAAQFTRLLREGPALGIHALVWCDTYGNVNRALDRQGLREIELRVLFQMNAGDSSNLIDSPVAAQLGVHRALLYNEGDGRLEKFRPYGPPGEEWLAWVQAQFHARLPDTTIKIDARAMG